MKLTYHTRFKIKRNTKNFTNIRRIIDNINGVGWRVLVFIFLGKSNLSYLGQSGLEMHVQLNSGRRILKKTSEFYILSFWYSASILFVSSWSLWICNEDILQKTKQKKKQRIQRLKQNLCSKIWWVSWHHFTPHSGACVILNMHTLETSDFFVVVVSFLDE